MTMRCAVGIALALCASAAQAGTVTLNWKDNCSSEQGFKIERATNQTGPFSEIATVGANVVTYKDTTAAAGATYYYRVRAYNGAWNSGYTNIAAKTLTPAVPTGLAAKAGAVRSRQITLTWTASAGATGYKIYRSTASAGTYTQVGTTGSTTFTNSALVAGTVYYYKIASQNAGGVSAQTAAVSAKAQ